MTRLRAVLVAGAVGLTSPLRAQLGEVQAGGLLSYGLEDAYGPGAGLVFGVAAGRITYIGTRWTYYTGSETRVTTPTGPVDVTSRVQVFAVDLGVQVPAGALEVIPGMSVGAARFAQHGHPVGGSETPGVIATEFFWGAGLSVLAHLGSLVVIPELQYGFAGDPQLPLVMKHQGLTASLRVAATFEVRRVRR